MSGNSASPSSSPLQSHKGGSGTFDGATDARELENVLYLTRVVLDLGGLAARPRAESLQSHKGGSGTGPLAA